MIAQPIGVGRHAPGTGRRGWIWPLALAATAIALYANALGNPFLSDDLALVSGNPTVTQPSAAGLLGLWTTDYWQGIDSEGRVVALGGDRNLYRPVTTLSYWLDAVLAGAQPLRFRLTNLLLHTAAAGLVGLWCARLTGSAAGGAVAAAFVLLHPTATDVVNRIAGRADILVVLAIAGCLATQRAAQTAGWTWRRTAAAALWAVVAFGAKESGLVLVPLMALQAWIGGAPAARLEHGPSAGGVPGARTERGSSGGRKPGVPPTPAGARGGQAAHGWRIGWRPLLAIGVPFLLYLAARLAVVGPPSYAEAALGGMANPLLGRSLLERLPASAALAWFYLTTILWPWPLIAFDLPTRAPAWSDLETWLGLLALVAVAAAAISLALRRHPCALGLVWWLAVFAVVGQLLVPLGTYREVRLAYTMIGGPAPLVAWLAARAVSTRPPLRRAALAAAVIAASVAAGLVVTRNVDFRSDIVLVEADLRRSPDNLATLVRLGGLYERAGRLAEAQRALARATELAPDLAQAWYELALYHERYGNKATARDLYERALTRDPAHVPALVSLGVITMDADDLETAARHLEHAELLAPDDEFVGYNLAVLAERRGDLDGAIARLEDLVRRHPDYAMATRGLAALRHVRAQSRGQR